MRRFYDLVVAGGDKGRIVFTTPRADYTFEQLDHAVHAYESLLSQEGSIQGKRIGILMPSVLDYAALVLAVIRSGGVVVPLSWQYRQQDLTAVLELVDPHMVFTVDECNGFSFTETIQANAEKSGKATLIYKVSAEGWILEEVIRITGVPRPLEAENVQMIGCTSGSTGVPKGIMLTEDALIRWSDKLLNATQLQSNDRIFQNIVMTAPFGWVWLFTALRIGAQTVVSETFEFPKMIRLLDKHRCSVISTTPSVFRAIYTLAKASKPDIFEQVRLGIFTGEAIPAEFLQYISPLVMGRYMSTYGLSELGVLMYTPGDIRQGMQWTVCPGIEYQVSEAVDHGVGEIIFQSADAFKGYYKRPDLTEEVRARDNWFYSGDLVRLNSNQYIEIVGRKKEMIKKGGQPIFPGEIENLLNRHSSVLQSAVVGVTDESLGEKIIAFLVVDGEISQKDLRAYCAKQVAAYKIPDQFEVVPEIPMIQGKTDKIKLRTMINQKREAGVENGKAQ